MTRKASRQMQMPDVGVPSDPRHSAGSPAGHHPARCRRRKPPDRRRTGRGALHGKGCTAPQRLQHDRRMAGRVSAYPPKPSACAQWHRDPTARGGRAPAPVLQEIVRYPISPHVGPLPNHRGVNYATIPDDPRRFRSPHSALAVAGATTSD